MATVTEKRRQREVPALRLGRALAASGRCLPLGKRENSVAGTFGVTLRRYRLRLGLSQNALAKVVGINASYINRLERGERRAPAREVAFALAEALALSADDVDRLLGSAGYLPPSMRTLDPADSTVGAVVRLLVDERLSPEVLADFRAVVETIAARWHRRCRQDTAQPLAALPKPDREDARPAPAAKASVRNSARAMVCTQVTIRPNSVAPLPVTGVGTAR
jgi:transcriptional regulator with XRE-family HTH domain